MPQPTHARRQQAADWITLALYAVIIILVTTFVLLATADHSPARAPLRSVCADDRAILAQVASQLGEDLAPFTVLGSSHPRVNTPHGPGRLPAYGLVTRADGRIHVGPHTPCDLVDDTLRHEYVHVLQWRAHGPDALAGLDVELVADTLARRWGNDYTPYLVEHGEPAAGHEHQADVLDATRGHG